jgi:hypothetical protein
MEEAPENVISTMSIAFSETKQFSNGAAKPSESLSIQISY